MPTAPSPGASSSSTRVSTPRRAGCTPRAACATSPGSWRRVTRKDGRYYYRYGDRELPVTTRRIVIRFKTPHGMAQKTFTAYYTQHGPVIARIGDKWETVNLMQRPISALIQDFSRTKARDYEQFRQTMRLHTNSSNNTVFADSEGNIAYWHSDWIPAAQRRLRLGQAGRRQQPRHRVSRPADARRDSAPAQSAQRLALQLQQLALVRGRPVQPEAAGLPALRRAGHGGDAARLSRAQGAHRPQELDHGLAHRGGIRQLPARIRHHDSGSDEGV